MTFSDSREQKYFSPFFVFFFTGLCLLKKLSVTCSVFEFVGKCQLGMLHGPVSLQCTKLNVQYLLTGHLCYYWEAPLHFDPFDLCGVSPSSHIYAAVKVSDASCRISFGKKNVPLGCGPSIHKIQRRFISLS